MLDRRHFTILQRVHKQTVERKLEWSPTARDNAVETFTTTYRLKLQEIPDTEYPDSPDFQLSIYDTDGRLIESFTNADLRPFMQEENPRGQNAYQLFEETFTLARRAALGVDVALDTLLDELGE